MNIYIFSVVFLAIFWFVGGGPAGIVLGAFFMYLIMQMTEGSGFDYAYVGLNSKDAYVGLPLETPVEYRQYQLAKNASIGPVFPEGYITIGHSHFLEEEHGISIFKYDSDKTWILVSNMPYAHDYRPTEFAKIVNEGCSNKNCMFHFHGTSQTK
jgi:hypothetical protein